MKHKIFAVFVGFLLFMLMFTLFGFNSTGLTTLFIQQNGNVVNYKMEKTGDMTQCLDVEPENNIFSKGSCHTQLHTANNVYGISSTDYCLNENEVVDYYCSSEMLCIEVVNACGEGFICSDGRCIEDFKPFKYFSIKTIGSRFRNLFPS